MNTAPQNNEWLPASVLAEGLDVTPSAVTYAERHNGRVAGQRVESRETTREDRERLGLNKQTRRLYRLVAEPTAADVDDLLADLAGCEARIEELEAKWDEAREITESCFEILEDVGLPTDDPDGCGLPGIVFDIARAAQQTDALKAENKWLRECVKHREGLLADARVQAESWKTKASRARCDRDDALGRADRLERQLNRGIVRRALRRVVEVVR